jgi:hypothetical protein
MLYATSYMPCRRRNIRHVAGAYSFSLGIMPQKPLQPSTFEQKMTKFVNLHYETEFDNRECHN